MPVMMLGSKPGTCAVCACAHDTLSPHSRDSLPYQIRFRDRHGRWPTWADAMAHCNVLIRTAWQVELEKRGVWTTTKKPIAEPVVVGDGKPIDLPSLEPKVVSVRRSKKDNLYMSYGRGDVKVEWEWIGEGGDGDYDDSDPEDEKLLRFTVLYKGEQVDDASYCTHVGIGTSKKMLRQMLKYIYNEVEEPLRNGHRIKKLCEHLSWIEPSWIKK